MFEPRLKVKTRPGQSAPGRGTPSDLAPLIALAAEEPTHRAAQCSGPGEDAPAT